MLEEVGRGRTWKRRRQETWRLDLVVVVLVLELVVLVIVVVLVMVVVLVARGEDWRGCCGLGGHLEEEYLLELIFDEHAVCPVLWSFP